MQLLYSENRWIRGRFSSTHTAQQRQYESGYAAYLQDSGIIGLPSVKISVQSVQYLPLHLNGTTRTRRR